MHYGRRELIVEEGRTFRFSFSNMVLKSPLSLQETEMQECFVGVWNISPKMTAKLAA